jgi:hypothetical protein
MQAVDEEPERIWLQPECCAGKYEGRQWCQDNVFDDGECEDGAKATEYVRADIAATRIEQLRKALETAADGFSRLSGAFGKHFDIEPMQELADICAAFAGAARAVIQSGER